jgi:hypothetical protein
MADERDLNAFLAEQDARREPKRPLNFGLVEPLAGATWVRPALVRRPPLPATGEARIRAGTLQAALSPAERAVLAILLEREALRVAQIVLALPELEAEAVRTAVAGLARKALVFLFDGAG